MAACTSQIVNNKVSSSAVSISGILPLDASEVSRHMSRALTITAAIARTAFAVRPIIAHRARLCPTARDSAESGMVSMSYHLNNCANSVGISGTGTVLIFTESPSLMAMRFFFAHSGSGSG